MNVFKSNQRSFKDKNEAFLPGLRKPLVKIPIPQIMLGIKKKQEEEKQEGYDLDHFAQYGTVQPTEEVFDEDPEIRIAPNKFTRQKEKKDQFSDKYIRYQDRKDSTNVRIVEKRTHTDAGDGADFDFSFKKNGKLNAKVKLAKKGERTSDREEKSLWEKSKLFLDDARDVKDLFQPTKEPEFDAKLETKAIAAMDVYRRRIGKKRARYKTVRLNSYKDVKRLKKEIKAEKKEERKREHDQYFNSSKVTFVSDEEKFSAFEDSFLGKAEEGSIRFIEAEAVSKIHSNKREIISSKEESSAFDKISNSNQPSGFSDMKNGIEREMTTEEKFLQKRTEVRAAKKEENKLLRRAAAVAALSKVIETKKNMAKELEDDTQVTGDLLADGNSGITKTITTTASNTARSVALRIAKALAKQEERAIRMVWKKVISFLFSIFGPTLLLITIISGLIAGIIGAIGGAVNSDEGLDEAEATSYDLNVRDSGTYLSTPYTDAEIDTLMEKLYAKYTDMTSFQEQTLRLALKAVGGAYDQGSHGNHRDNVWDCSELAYVAWKNAGIDISYGGGYCAADECKMLASQHKNLTGNFTMKPGDLIFYGGKNNGRYLGVYHVAIYLGNIDGVDRMVEAYGKSRGVIVSDIRNRNKIVSISRPV
ncbi:C40 family peptidase [[Clostridium] aminophilum]|uniref:C40 family peptidase n=1 Tax=[Clostridium] aminophilum TaxID=1526 RepID=UPI003F94A0B2